MSVWSLTEMTIPVCERVAVVIRSDAAFDGLQFTFCFRVHSLHRAKLCPLPQTCPVSVPTKLVFNGYSFACTTRMLRRSLNNLVDAVRMASELPWLCWRKVSLCLCFRDAQPVPWIEIYQQREPLGYRNPELSLCDVTSR